MPGSEGFIGSVAVDALAGRSCFFAEPLLLHMTFPAQRVELLFDQGIYGRICLVTVEAQTSAAVVNEIVMAVDAVIALPWSA